MLEIPESYTIARQLNEMVAGRRVTEVQAAQSPHGFAWYQGDPAGYPMLLENRTIGSAAAEAGYIRINAEDTTLLLHDGVNLRLLPPGLPLPKKHQLYLALDDGSSLICTVQMYGGMMAFPAGSYHTKYYDAACEKPNPLTDAFDRAWFDALVKEADPKLSVKALLATEQRIPGLGNGCLQDILYCAGVNPQSKLSALKEADLESLYHCIKHTLREMAEQGGRDVEKDLFGKAGGYHTVLSSKTAAYACRQCGGGITRKAYMGGNVYFCPVCQPAVK